VLHSLLLAAAVATHGVAVLDAHGNRVATLPAAGPVTAAVPDGRGGWYVGGSFQHLGGTARNHLAHLGPDLTIDGRWHPWVEVHSAAYGFGVSSLALAARRVYAQGTFLRANGARVRGLAAFAARTGALERRWRPPVSGEYLLRIEAAGPRIVLAGSFRSGGRYDLLAVDATTGRADAWGPRLRPAPSPSAFGEVRAFGGSSRMLYAFGPFEPGGVSAFDRATGKPDRSFHPASRPEISALAAGPHRVFVSGPGLAALDADTGAALRWRPACTCAASRLAVQGRRLYAATGAGLVALDSVTGRRLPAWSHPQVTALAASANRLLVAW
jgi:outer membrane protein assembly factor BamB